MDDDRPRNVAKVGAEVASRVVQSKNRACATVTHKQLAEHQVSKFQRSGGKQVGGYATIVYGRVGVEGSCKVFESRLAVRKDTHLVLTHPGGALRTVVGICKVLLRQRAAEVEVNKFAAWPHGDLSHVSARQLTR